MLRVGVRELRARTSEILREVQTGQVYEITHRGKVIARLVPETDPEEGARQWQEWWREWDEFSEEIGKRWPEGLPAVAAIRADRDRA